MAWYEISTAEIAPRQPLDNELFTKIRNNLNLGLCSLGLPQIIPNGSFEHSTGTAPHLWTITTYSSAVGGSGSISTVSAHGANALRLTKNSSVSKVNAFTEDYIAVASTQITVHGIMWPSTSTGVRGGLAIRCYLRDFTTATPDIVETDCSVIGRATTPTTYTVVFGYSSLTRYIKLGCCCNSDSTVAGSFNFDALYIQNT